MKAYIEYEDRTFWAIYTEGGDYITLQGNKYDCFIGNDMIIDDEGTPMGRRKIISFDNPTEAEKAAAKLINERSEKNENGAAAIKQDNEFWLDAIQRDPYRLFFVPDEYKTKELYALAVAGGAFEDVLPEMWDTQLCKQVLNKRPRALEFIPESLITEEMCVNAMKTKSFYKKALAINVNVFRYIPKEYINMQMCKMFVEKSTCLHAAFSLIPAKYLNDKLIEEIIKKCGTALHGLEDKYKTEKLCLLAVKNNGRALRYVPMPLLTAEICLEAVKETGYALKYVPLSLMNGEICMEAVKQNSKAIKYVEVNKLTSEDHTEICRLSVESS